MEKVLIDRKAYFDHRQDWYILPFHSYQNHQNNNQAQDRS